jgi:hypothetical protein
MGIRRKMSRAVFEAVESRVLCSVTIPAFPLGITQVPVFDGTQLVVTGTTGTDSIAISQISSSSVLVSDGRMGSKIVNGTFSSIEVIGNGGRDTVYITHWTHINCLVYGGGGNCVIIDQGTGNDEIWTGTGNDYVVLGSGNDTVVTVGAASANVIGGTGLDSFWMDAAPTEVLHNVTAAETAAGNVHQISSFLEAGATLASTTETIGGKVYTIYTPPTGTAAATNPTGAGTYVSYSSNPLFSDSGPTANDVFQSNLVNDCFFEGPLAAIAATDPNHIRQSIADLGDGTYAVRFTTPNGVNEYVRVTDTLLTSGGSPEYAGLGAQGSTWAALIEKAYAVVCTGADTYTSLGSVGSPSLSFENMNASSVWGLQGVTSAQKLLSQMNSDLASGAAVTYAMAGHDYTVLSVNMTTDQVLLRNPYGSDVTLTAAQAYADFQLEVAATV